MLGAVVLPPKSMSLYDAFELVVSPLVDAEITAMCFLVSLCDVCAVKFLSSSFMYSSWSFTASLAVEAIAPSSILSSK